ncbi:putative retrotransposon protein [Tanacetum coccineum]
MIGCKVMRTLASVEIEIMVTLGLPCFLSSSGRCLESVSKVVTGGDDWLIYVGHACPRVVRVALRNFMDSHSYVSGGNGRDESCGPPPHDRIVTVDETTCRVVAIEIMVTLGLPCFLSSSGRCLESVSKVVTGGDDCFHYTVGQACPESMLFALENFMDSPRCLPQCLLTRRAYLDGTETESKPFEDPIHTETLESPLAIAPPISLSESTSSVLIPILRRTARMAVRVPHAMSSGLSASMAEVAAMSESALRKRFWSFYESSPSVSPPDLPSRKRYRGTSELVEDSEEDDEEEDEEMDESMDSDSVSEDAEDEGPTTKDEDPAAEDEGLTARARAPSDRLGLEEDEEAAPGGQQQAALVVETAVSVPLGLGYGALRCCELALEEGDVYSTFEVGQGSGSAPEFERPKRVSAFRQPTLTTWTDPEDGMIYIDIPAYPPPAPPVQTPPSPEWTSGSLLISLSHSDVPSPISSPMIPLIVPSLIATPTAVKTEGFLTVLGAQVEMHGGLIRDHAVRLDELSPALFKRYDRDIGELLTRSCAGVVAFACVIEIGLLKTCLRCVKSKVCDWYWKRKDVTQGDWVEMVVVLNYVKFLTCKVSVNFSFMNVNYKVYDLVSCAMNGIVTSRVSATDELDDMNVEMQSMKANQVWCLVDLPPNCRTVRSKWLFKKKTDMDENVRNFKAHLVAKGYTQIYGINYGETLSPATDIIAIRILLAIAVFYDYQIWQIDIKIPFLNGQLSEGVYMVKPEGFVDPKHPRKTNKDDTKSKSGYVFVLNGGAMDWKSAKKFIDGLGNVMPTNKRPMEMLCDNIVAIDIASDPGIMKGPKHYQRKYHYIRGVIQDGEIVLKKVYIDDNVADPFTKPMPYTKHFDHAMGIGVHPATSLM